MDVLLIEDEVEMRVFLQAVLESRGHTVTVAADGESGWEFFQQRHFHMVVLDWILPGMDGLKVCRKIRHSKQRTNCLILMITSRANPGDLKQVLAAGADDYLAKPVDPEILDIRLEIAEQRVRNMIYRQEIEATQQIISSELRKTNETLKEAQRLAQVGSWDLDLLSGKLAWSDQVFNLFEIDKSQFAATYAAFLDIVHPEDVEMVNRAYTQSLETQSPYKITHRLLMDDGRIKWVEERCTSLFDVEGNAISSHGTVQDVTQRKHFENDLILAKEQAEEAGNVKNEFLTRMSHELRTPLNSIIGFTQILQMVPDNETLGMHRENFNTVIRAGWHLLRLIEDLLNLSAIEANKIALNIESLDVREVMHECFAMMSPLANERKMELACADDHCDGVFVRADAFRLKQVVINLLANAVKYNREGGTITVCGRRTAGHIRILISDTGSGIPENEIASLFQPFSRLVQRPYSAEGAGIGLSIAKQLTELMGGSIGVESVYGQGSTFWIELPSVECDSSVAGSSIQHEQAADTENKSCLLYIEDNPDHMKLVGEIVSRMDNLTLMTAHTPSLGLDLARTRKPDLILLDICLPGMSGYQVFKLLKANEHTLNIPVMAISASTSPAEIEKGLLAGFRRYFTKPLNVLEFRTAVEELLRDSLKV